MQGAALGAALITCVAAGLATAAPSPPRLTTERGCYVVGQPVAFHGSGFASSAPYVVDIDGVYFGQASTDPAGSLNASLRPGGLAAGVAESNERLTVSDGSLSASTSFTVTRRTGAAFFATRGTGPAPRARLEAWDFAPDGRAHSVYIHYVAPSGRPVASFDLGRTSGQCGFLVTRALRVFPFTPSRGRWTLQLDTSHAYHAKRRGPVARIRVRVG